MRRQANKFIFYCLLILSVACIGIAGSYAQGDTMRIESPGRNITHSEWNEITNDPEFYYRDSTEYKPKPIVKTKPGFFERFLIWLATGTGRVIAWGVLVLIVGYAVFRVVIGERGGIFARKSKKETSDTEESNEEDISETNWEQLLQKAAKDGDLRLAVRYSYMWLLQVLQHSRLIEYRNDKTNYEYYSELADSPYKTQFRQLSRQYEYTWYGGFGISQESYDEYIAQFYRLQKQLDRR
jgi:hypothetical protein